MRRLRLRRNNKQRTTGDSPLPRGGPAQPSLLTTSSSHAPEPSASPSRGLNVRRLFGPYGPHAREAVLAMHERGIARATEALTAAVQDQQTEAIAALARLAREGDGLSRRDGTPITTEEIATMSLDDLRTTLEEQVELLQAQVGTLKGDDD